MGEWFELLLKLLWQIVFDVVCTVAIKCTQKVGCVSLSTKVNQLYLSIKWLTHVISLSVLTLVFWGIRVRRSWQWSYSCWLVLLLTWISVNMISHLRCWELSHWIIGFGFSIKSSKLERRVEANLDWVGANYTEDTNRMAY